jgi:hypothetical protein
MPMSTRDLLTLVASVVIATIAFSSLGWLAGRVVMSPDPVGDLLASLRVNGYVVLSCVTVAAWLFGRSRAGASATTMPPEPLDFPEISQ